MALLLLGSTALLSFLSALCSGINVWIVWKRFKAEGGNLTRDLPQPDQGIVIKNRTGAELMFPSPIKEAFDSRQVKSIADILS